MSFGKFSIKNFADFFLKACKRKEEQRDTKAAQMLFFF